MYFEDPVLGAVLHFKNLKQMREKTLCKTKTCCCIKMNEWTDPAINYVSKYGNC